jgi:uncharacterized protein (DUF58 family)
MQHIGYALIGIELLGLLVTRLGGQGLIVSSRADRMRLSAGDEVEETYVLEKRSRWPAAWVEITPEGAIDREHVSLPPGGTRIVKHARRLPVRGHYWVAGGTIRVRDPLGLFALTRVSLDPVEVTVYPRPIEVPDAVDAARALVSSQHRWRLGGADATLGDLRDYVPGDAPSRIHWRSTARRGALMVTDPETHRRRAHWLLVDLSGDDDDAERAAGIAAYLAEKLWRSSQAVGAVITGEELVVIPARRGREQAATILDGLANVQTSPDSQLERLLRAATQCENPGSFVLISAAVGSGEEVYRPRTSDPFRRLRAVCPVIRVIPVVQPEELAG